MKQPFLSLIVALALVAPACLENEEEITVRPDGSIHVQVSAKGDVADLAQGYPVPFGGPWQPSSDDAREWLTAVGSATGGAAVLARIADEQVLGKPDTERRLEVEATFASPDDLPARFADRTDPYAEAYLERSASLQVLKRGNKTIYVFERTLHARPCGRGIFERLYEEEQATENAELLEKFNNGSLTEKEWQAAVDELTETHRSLAHSFAREAFASFYTRGSAAVTASATKALWTRLGDRVAEIFALPRLKALPAGDDEALHVAWTRMYGEYRDMIREEVARTLAEAGVSREEQNAVAFALEREFTAYDHSMDLWDEGFRVRITLPGELVAGNFDEWSGSTAWYEVGGSELMLGDVTLRAVSVVE